MPRGGAGTGSALTHTCRIMVLTDTAPVGAHRQSDPEIPPWRINPSIKAHNLQLRGVWILYDRGPIFFIDFQFIDLSINNM